ncbi:hypothetical protein NEOLEDRAFT_1054965 [Neolentinus lepideus HHB14362 ss-1]|uniref:NADH-ubiquinone oxidoreductase 9.5 kDa subunit n=1 Tax=Neolentinus lepideus HHB14362 ss-1 TaxID=1314782 RepID=A0A165VS14_9AGAM|nr:hypothetical protein NEOLEDRAFT_1054965 [Neolentinus lepideus HHB14362 ss-1]
MASISSIFSPFRNTYRYLHRQAHENPVILFSVILGSLGPVTMIVVPQIRARLGYKPAPPIPTSYPVPDRPRRPVEGYEDE